MSRDDAIANLDDLCAHYADKRLSASARAAYVEELIELPAAATTIAIKNLARTKLSQAVGEMGRNGKKGA